MTEPRHRQPLAEYPASRIALLKPSALGDIMHSLPVLTALRHRYPTAHITWIVNRLYEPLLHGHPDLNDTLAFDRQALRGGMVAAVRCYTHFCRELRRRRFDLVIDLQGLLRSGLMALASGAPRRVGLACAREGARWFYTDLVPVPDFTEAHAVDRYWRVITALGGGGAKEFRLAVASDAHQWALEVLSAYPRPWLAVGVGARWLTKRWPPGHFTALLRQAQQYGGGTAVFIGGGDEAELAQLAASGLPGPVLHLSGRTSLPQLAAVLRVADVVVANDTGPLHLAVALGRPVVAPYTCTQVCRTGPYGQADHAVETTVSCRGSLRKQCARLDCLAELTPARLWPILHGILQTWQQLSRSA